MIGPRSNNMISDVIRRDQSSKFRQHSITLISPYEGMTVDIGMQKSQNGKHLVDSVDSYIFSNGSLEKTMSNSSNQENTKLRTNYVYQISFWNRFSLIYHSIPLSTENK